MKVPPTLLIQENIYYISFFSFFPCFFFLFSLTNALLYQLREVYAALWAAKRFVGSKTPKHNDFDQFWKLKFHFERFPLNTQFLSFDSPSDYLCPFKNHQQAFSWPGDRPWSQRKVTKMWFAPNIKYLTEPFFVDFCCREDISCFTLYSPFLVILEVLEANNIYVFCKATAPVLPRKNCDLILLICNFFIIVFFVRRKCATVQI